MIVVISDQKGPRSPHACYSAAGRKHRISTQVCKVPQFSPFASFSSNALELFLFLGLHCGGGCLEEQHPPPTAADVSLGSADMLSFPPLAEHNHCSHAKHWGSPSTTSCLNPFDVRLNSLFPSSVHFCSIL